MNNRHIGSNFDNFLAENEMLAECQAEAIKRVIAWQLQQYMEKKSLSKTAFARMLKTSRSALDRLLDPDNASLNLKTLSNAAEAMGKHLEIKII